MLKTVNNAIPIHERIKTIRDKLISGINVLPEHIFSLLDDISTYLQQQNNDEYRLFFEQAKTPILLIDPNTQAIKNVNVAAENFYGYSRQQLLQLKIGDINCLTEEQILSAIASAQAEHSSFFLFPHRLASGEIRQVEVSTGPITVNGQDFLYSTIYDTTDRDKAIIQLLESEARYRALHNSIPTGCLTQDPDMNVLAINDEACTIFGVDRNEIEHNNLANMTWVRVRENGEILSLNEHPAVQCMDTSQPIRGFIMGLKSADHTTWLSVNSQPIFHVGDTKPYAVISSFNDITAQKQIEDELSLAASVFTHAKKAIMITDVNANIVKVNNAFTEITGYSFDEVIGRNPRLFQSGYMDATFYQSFWQQLLEEGHWRGEIWNRRKNGEIFVEQLTISAVKNHKNEIHHYVSLFSDITNQKQYEKQLEQQAFYDPLTGLPNRTFFTDKLTLAIHQKDDSTHQLAVAYIDLDGFKQVNDRYGHAAGDQLLITTAQRMKQILRGTDLVARFGGDEFVAMFTANTTSDNAHWEQLAKRLLNTITQPLQIGHREFKVSASIGFTYHPTTQDISAEQLIVQADQAMYRAKQAGKGRYHFYDKLSENS